jgi:type IV pilus assembly protein PilM
MQGKYVGLDIGSYTVKAVELTEKKNELILSNAYLLNTPSETIIDGAVVGFTEISDILKQLFESGGFVKKQVNLAVKGSNTISRRARIPFISEEQLRRNLVFIANQYMRASPDQYSIDYEIVHVDRTMSKATVTYAAADKGFLNDYHSVIMSADLELGIIDMESFALVALYNKLGCPLTSTSVIINTGHASNQVIFIENGSFAYQEYCQSGGGYCNTLLANIANLPDESIPILKSNPDTSTESETIKKVIKSNYCPELLKDIENIIKNYELLGGKMPEFGYIAGGGALLHYLQEFLTETLKFHFSILDPSDIIKADSTYAVQIFKTMPAVLDVAIGMALKDE